MRFLLGLGVGLLLPLISRAWLKLPGQKTAQKILGVEDKIAGDESRHGTISPTSPNKAANMSSEERPAEFEWPKVQGNSQDSDFQW
ncbi:MAG: hypothetical protein ACLFQG_04670 [Desulfovermiculus sp.]